MACPTNLFPRLCGVHPSERAENSWHVWNLQVSRLYYRSVYSTYFPGKINAQAFIGRPERLPYTRGSMRSIYHTREFDVRRLSLVGVQTMCCVCP
jgi:hypothetical protein